MQGKIYVQKTTYLQLAVLQHLDFTPSLETTGKFTRYRYNLPPYPISTRLTSTTAVQHELRNTTQTQPSEMEPMPKAQPRGPSSTTDAEWKSTPPADRDKLSPTTQPSKLMPKINMSQSMRDTTTPMFESEANASPLLYNDEDLRHLDSTPSLEETGKSNFLRFNLASQSNTPRLKSTTDVQQELRETPEGQPR